MTEPVLIRVWKQGDQDVKKYGLKEVHISDMIMIFPCDPGVKSYWCGSYQVNGQHGECDYFTAILPNTRPATKEESERLVEHYQHLYGVSLKVYRRWQHWFDVERLKEIK